MKKFLLMLSVLFLMNSCSNDEPSDEKDSQNRIEYFSMIAKYKGKYYNVEGITQGENVFYLNEDFNDVYQNEISKLPQKAIILYPDINGNKIVGYYSSVEELEKDNDMNPCKINVGLETRVDNVHMYPDESNLAGTAILYDDTDFKDRTVRIDVASECFICTHLKDLGGFNDKTSAIRVLNYMTSGDNFTANVLYTPGETWEENNGAGLRICLIGYENNLYIDQNGRFSVNGGDVLYCVSSHTGLENENDPTTAQHQDWKLKEIGWNDKITGVVVGVMSTTSLNRTIFPHVDNTKQ